MLGYVTKKQAKAAGMTHSGSYYCIPLWMEPEHPDFIVWAKWTPMEYLMPIFHNIEGLMRSIMYLNSKLGK